MSEVSIISGRHPPSSSGRSIINISLPGANQPFSYHEVRVWCRPPDKQSTEGGQSEALLFLFIIIFSEIILDGFDSLAAYS